jgi:hypothetical protein
MVYALLKPGAVTDRQLQLSVHRCLPPMVFLRTRVKANITISCFNDRARQQCTRADSERRSGAHLRKNRTVRLNICHTMQRGHICLYMHCNAYHRRLCRPCMTQHRLLEHKCTTTSKAAAQPCAARMRGNAIQKMDRNQPEHMRACARVCVSKWRLTPKYNGLLLARLKQLLNIQTLHDVCNQP